MKAFNFSLNTLLKVKSHAFEKDALSLARLQKRMHQLNERKQELQETFEELLEASITMPSLSQNLELVSGKIAIVEEEIRREKRLIAECRKSVTNSLNKRKVVEKIKENHYALYQKECVRLNETSAN